MKHTSFRERFIRIQKKAYLRANKHIQQSFHTDSNIAVYQKHYEKYLKKYEKIASWSDLYRKMTGVRLIYHGDYHTLKQSQKSVKQCIEKLSSDHKISLCLEIFKHDHQKHIDLYLSGKLTVKQLFQKTKYHEHWGFQWKTWAEILAFCKKVQIPVLGLDGPEESHFSLKERDQYAANIIALEYIQKPKHILYVVMGDFHICPEHLPHEVYKLLKVFSMTADRLLIYQNAENLYWQLASEGLEDSSVLQVDKESFCVMNSTPAHKWQSYVNWLESADDSFYPSPQDFETQHDHIHGFSTIPQMVGFIAKLLNIELPKDPFTHLHIYYAHHLSFTQTMYEDPCFRPIIPLIEKKMLQNEAFLLESSCGTETRYIIFLPSPSINMASEEASHFLNAYLRGYYSFRGAPFDRFYRNVMTECLGFLGSKLVNPKRSIFMLSDLRRTVFELKKKIRSREEEQVLTKSQFILRHVYLENQTQDACKFKIKFEDFYKKELKGLTEYSTQLGHFLGNKLFLALKKDRISVDEINRLFFMRFEQSGAAFGTYMHWVKKMKRVSHFESGFKPKYNKEKSHPF